jgi:hypothetical protein
VLRLEKLIDGIFGIQPCWPHPRHPRKCYSARLCGRRFCRFRAPSRCRVNV